MFEYLKLKNTYDNFLNRIIKDSEEEGGNTIEEKFRFIENIAIIYIENIIPKKYKQKKAEGNVNETEIDKRLTKSRFIFYSLYNKKIKKLKKKCNLIHKDIDEETIEKVIELHARVLNEEQNNTKI